MSGSLTTNYHTVIDGKQVDIPVDNTVYAYLNEQFFNKGGKNADRRRATLNNLIIAAYKKGLQDGWKK